MHTSILSAIMPSNDRGEAEPHPEYAQCFFRHEIEQGLRNEEFTAFYHPKLSIDGGRLEGVEVLPRWQHPRQGLVAPAHFFEDIQRHDLVDVLFLQLFKQGLGLRQRLVALGHPIGLSWDLQSTQLGDALLVQTIRSHLEHYFCPAPAITFEINESSAFNATEDRLKTLIALRLLGCNLSMDHFGTGGSSLARLCELPFNELKLDASFAQRLASHPDCVTVIQHVIPLARALGCAFVVNGVDTLAQIKQLRNLGCSVVQGYGVAQPMPEAALIPYLLELGAFEKSTRE